MPMKMSIQFASMSGWLVSSAFCQCRIQLLSDASCSSSPASLVGSLGLSGPSASACSLHLTSGDASHAYNIFFSLQPLRCHHMRLCYIATPAVVMSLRLR